MSRPQPDLRLVAGKAGVETSESTSGNRPGSYLEYDNLGQVTVSEGYDGDGVTVVDPAAVVGQSARGVNDLYVALTRPTQRLTVLHHGDLPPGLDGLAPTAFAAAGAPAPRAPEPDERQDTLF